MVASVVDFLTGMSAEGDELLVGLGLLFGSGEGDFVAAGELEGLGFGAGVGDFFSVVTETLGSEVEDSVFRETDASGELSGAGLDSSWAGANGAPAIRNTAERVRMVSFISLSLQYWFR